MTARFDVVLPGYDSYRSVLSNETAVFQKPSKPVEIEKRKDTYEGDVIKDIVSNSLGPKDTVPLSKALLEETTATIHDLGKNDADDLEDSGEYE
jgi:hypothetical protein